MKKLTFLFFIIAMIFLAVPHAGLAANDLQQMIDILEDGDILQLEDKTYEGNITIDKSIELIGQTNTVIKGNGAGNVISIQAPHVTIRNVAVTGGSMNRNSSEEYAGIKVYSDHNVIDGVIIKHSFHGIYLSQAHHNIIENSQITGVGKEEIAGQGNGLHIYYSNDNLLKNNVVKSSRDGIFFDYANDNQIVDNMVSETRYGLHYMYSDDNFFKGNTFTMNTGGAAIMHSNGIRLEENKFIFNYGHKSFGLLLLSSRDTTILENTFSLNQRGLYIDQATGSLIKNNRILNNQVGIELWASSNEQVFTLNKIDENTIPVASLGGEGRNHWSENGKGNHWGQSFPMLDLNQDGIGDEKIVYQSSLHELLENQELVYLFLKSPAIAIYEKMNQFFHKEKTMFTDPYPIVQEHESKMSWVILVGALLIAAYLYQKKKLL
ncbi:nitrous oxide reductase family maturation protein NosD [Robertmurraya sp. 2P01SA]